MNKSDKKYQTVQNMKARLAEHNKMAIKKIDLKSVEKIALKMDKKGDW